MRIVQGKSAEVVVRELEQRRSRLDQVEPAVKK